MFNIVSDILSLLRKTLEDRTRNGVRLSYCSANDKEHSEDEESFLESHPIEDKLLQEVRIFTLASHLFWGLWSIVQAHVSKIPFGYLVRHRYIFFIILNLK